MCLRIYIWLLVPGSAAARWHYQGTSMCLVVGEHSGQNLEWSLLSWSLWSNLEEKQNQEWDEYVGRSAQHETWVRQKHRCRWCLGRRMVKGCSGRWGRRDGAGPDAEGTSVPCGEAYCKGRGDIRGIWWTKSSSLTFVSEGSPDQQTKGRPEGS